MSQTEHNNNLQRLCRICGGRRNKGRPYRCQAFEDGMKETFGIDITDDQSDIHPKNLCFKCQLHVSESFTPTDFIPIEWKAHHDADECWVCDQKSVPRPEIYFSSSSKQSSKRRKADSQQSFIKKEVPIKLSALNDCIICSICKGYLIDVTTVTECLHSFCKSCLVQHLQTRQTCPKCGILIHETAPMQHVGYDTQFQDIIYKLVPGLADNETRRVKEFYASRSLSVPQKGAPSRPLTPAVAVTDPEQGKFPPNDGRPWFHAHDVRIALCIEPKENDSKMQQMPMKYVRCSMRLKVEHLAKFIKQKISISDDLELTCNKQLLDGSSTLENIWLEAWKVKEAPMRLYYNKK